MQYAPPPQPPQQVQGMQYGPPPQPQQGPGARETVGTGVPAGQVSISSLRAYNGGPIRRSGGEFVRTPGKARREGTPEPRRSKPAPCSRGFPLRRS